MAILVHFGPFLGLGGVFFLAENFFLGTHLSFMTLLNGFFTLWSNPREKVENLQISGPPNIEKSCPERVFLNWLTSQELLGSVNLLNQKYWVLPGSRVVQK